MSDKKTDEKTKAKAKAKDKETAKEKKQGGKADENSDDEHDRRGSWRTGDVIIPPTEFSEKSDPQYIVLRRQSTPMPRTPRDASADARAEEQMPGNLGVWQPTTKKPNPMPGTFAEFKVVEAKKHYTEVEELPRQPRPRSGSIKPKRKAKKKKDGKDSSSEDSSGDSEPSEASIPKSNN